MIAAFVALAGLAFATTSAGPVVREQQAPESMITSHQVRTLQPGEVVLLTVKLADPAASVTARGLDQVVRFFPTSDPAVWHGLLGIDLNTTPGTYTVYIDALKADESILGSQYPLVIRPKEFPSRQLTVDPAFVTPPANVMKRIRRESERTSTIFRTYSPRRLWAGPFKPPVPGDPLSSFGRQSIFNGEPRSQHSGTDFRASEGTPVRAPNAGEVVLVADLYFSGKTVIIDHGLGLYSYLAHLSRTNVREGVLVAPGDVVGYAGATGRVTGPHLHWTVRLNNTRVDPLSLMAVRAEP